MGPRYETSGERTSDAFFDVFQGGDRDTGEPVLVHVLRETCGLAEAELRQVAEEAEYATRLLHPHIVATRAVRFEEGRPVVISGLPRGESLESALEAGPMRASAVARLGTHVCEALAYAHERGVCHGALSPAHIHPSGEKQAEVSGFGTWGALSRHRGAAAYVRRQRVAYISPEEARGEPPGASADIYALGVILFQMATGGVPFTSGDPLVVARAHCQEPPPRPSEWAPGLPAALERCIIVALEKNPAHRYASAKELLLELRRIAEDLEREEAAAEAQMAQVVAELPEEPLEWKEAARGVTWVLGRGVLGLLVILAGALGATSLVFLVLASPQPEVSVPDVTGMSLEEAEQLVEPLGLDLVAADEEYSDEVPAGAIARMITPYAGKKVRRGRQVRVSVSRGERKLPVPYLVDLDLDGAKEKLKAADLPLGKVVKEHNSMTPKGIVLRQQPEGGSRVPEGSTVSLVVSEGPEELPKLDPDKMYSYKVRVRVPPGEGTHRVRIDVEDEGGATRMAYSELHAAGDQVTETVAGKGSAVVRVYVDDELVQETRTGQE